MSSVTTEYRTLPEQSKEQLIGDGLIFMATISEAFGPEKGMEVWERISEVIDQDLKGEMFFRMLTGHSSSRVTVLGHLGYRTKFNSFVELIKLVRNYTGCGLKEAKDFCDLISDGKDGTLTLESGRKKLEFVKELRALHITAR